MRAFGFFILGVGVSVGFIALGVWVGGKYLIRVVTT